MSLSGNHADSIKSLDDFIKVAQESVQVVYDIKVKGSETLDYNRNYESAERAAQHITTSALHFLSFIPKSSGDLKASDKPTQDGYVFIDSTHSLTKTFEKVAQLTGVSAFKEMRYLPDNMGHIDDVMKLPDRVRTIRGRRHIGKDKIIGAVVYIVIYPDKAFEGKHVRKPGDGSIKSNIVPTGDKFNAIVNKYLELGAAEVRVFLSYDDNIELSPQEAKARAKETERLWKQKSGWFIEDLSAVKDKVSLRTVLTAGNLEKHDKVKFYGVADLSKPPFNLAQATTDFLTIVNAEFKGKEERTTQKNRTDILDAIIRDTEVVLRLKRDKAAKAAANKAAATKAAANKAAAKAAINKAVSPPIDNKEVADKPVARKTVSFAPDTKGDNGNEPAVQSLPSSSALIHNRLDLGYKPLSRERLDAIASMAYGVASALNETTPEIAGKMLATAVHHFLMMSHKRDIEHASQISKADIDQAPKPKGR